MTAKTPFKVHLRLRFQNLGKPRTAGLCGREGSLCDHLSLSCAKIERPSPLEKPSCKVQLFAQNHSRKYRQKVTVTTSNSKRFSTSLTNGPRLLSQAKAGTHSAFGERSHTRAHTAKQGLFRMGPLSLPSIRAARSRISPGRVSERRTLPLWDLGRGCSRRTQKAFGTAMRLCTSLSRRRRGPAGLRDLFAFVEMVDLYIRRSWFSACARRGVVSPLLVCSACC